MGLLVPLLVPVVVRLCADFLSPYLAWTGALGCRTVGFRRAAVGTV